MKLSSISELLATPLFGGDEDLFGVLLREVVVNAEEVPLFSHQLAFLFGEKSPTELVRALEEALHSAALHESDEGVVIVEVVSDETKHSTIEANMKLRVPIKVVYRGLESKRIIPVLHKSPFSVMYIKDSRDEEVIVFRSCRCVVVGHAPVFDCHTNSEISMKRLSQKSAKTSAAVQVDLSSRSINFLAAERCKVLASTESIEDCSPLLTLFMP